MNPVLVEAVRGPAVESMHRGAFAVVDADGALIASAGDIDRPVFPRSAVQALQALPLVAGGAADRFGLGDAELALACASHNGEPEHVATAAGMLAKAGLDAGALECGTHWPALDTAGRELAAHGEAPTALHNNCSGKHAGFLCVGCLLAAAAGRDAREFVRGYVEPGHPVMREVGAALQRTTGADVDAAPAATDGCSIPTYAFPLRALALAFARVATGVGLAPDHARAAMRLRRAVAREPLLVAGHGRADTRVMERLGERVCCKVGAEGVYCAALPERGLGVGAADERALLKHIGLVSRRLGKSALALEQAAARGEDLSSARIVCADTSFARLARIRDARVRLGHAELMPVCADAAHPAFFAMSSGPQRGGFDRILVDAPCSNLGVLRRRPEARWHWSEEKLAALAARQRALLAATAALLRPGGRLVYATCSAEAEETVDVVRDFLAAHPDFKAVDGAGLVPAALCRDGFLRVWPGETDYDGFFAAAIIKMG